MVVDEKADARQRAALVALAKHLGGTRLETVVDVQSAPMDLTIEDHHAMAMSFDADENCLHHMPQAPRARFTAGDLMEIATIDVLTRVPNRRATQAFLEKERSRAQRQRSEFSLLLIDIDDFKKVNDRWGHAAGDEVLVRTASLFQSIIRKQDLVGRWGGEEFLIIVPGICDTKALAERIRFEIASTTFHHGTDSFQITVSIGITCANQTSFEHELLKKADNALYQAKLTKNTVRVAEELPETSV